MDGIGGSLVVEALRRRGIDTLFTLTGGHLFPVYDAWVKAGAALVDTRHEATAAFAAEGLAKLTRKPQVVAVTAGPGVTNVVSALGSAKFNGSPLLVIGGRAPQARWGQGSLQEMDHLPLVQGVVKRARTVFDPSQIPAEIDAALAEATRRPRGPVFLDIPLDIMFTPGQADDGAPSPLDPPSPAPAAEDIEGVARLLAEAARPVLVAGSDVYWDGAWDSLRALAEAAHLPVVLNGMGRGLLPPGHPNLFARARGMAFKGADLVMVAGTPLDFRLGFGQFGAARVVHLQGSPGQLSSSVELAGSAAGDLGAVLDGLRAAAGDAPANRQEWLDKLAAEERARRQQELELLRSDAEPIHPARVHGELRELLDDDAVVIGDGGDFVSFAGKYLEAASPGRWMDPGPFGCLGTGLGYTMAARLAHPDSQVVLLAGDGALGFSLMDFDSLVRHELPAVIVCGNNGSWGLEAHPMRQLFGHSAAADLRPETRYDQVAEGLGGKGMLVRRPDELRPALEEALAAGVPTLVNVLLDPAVAYPRRANLA